ncbi:methylglyoxal synthase [Chryseobacterium sp. POL2]|uniref:methylglyoxal synthase n=1 Tax=Chryseobacterium sp. POL2 TaxID=2713414 RepID=UPI0013E2089F|nr:methylglyoxal synthase [Chryseobacterium sp. POL2]QIG88294.1 methylglyoxal synthase [Chryseobacterium sp. POL2]
MKEQKQLPAQKTIALVAHDHKKDELLDWVKRHKNILIQHNLVATGTTGKLISESLNVDVQRVLSGPLGGDQQLGSMIAEGKINMVIFFWDPMESQPHDSDVKAFLRLCVVWNIPTASNSASADFLITSKYMDEDYLVEIPNYSNYLNRNINKGI